MSDEHQGDEFTEDCLAQPGNQYFDYLAGECVTVAETSTVKVPHDTLPATGGADIIAWLLVAVGAVALGWWLLITAKEGIR